MEIPADLVITMDDICKAGFCARKTPWWFSQHGLDFRHFHKNGILATDLAATGDAIALQVIQRTMDRSRG